MSTFSHLRSALVAVLPLALAAPASADLRWVDFMPGAFVDIAATGTQLTPFNDGEFDIVTTVGNSRFPAGTARISVNGGVRFGIALPGNGDLAPQNEPIPSALAFNGNRALLPFWDDFISTNGAFVFGSIQHQEVNGMYIVQWTNVKLQTAALQDRITFQLQIPASGPVFARFVYDDVSGIANGGSSATIGFQGPTQSNFVQHSFDAGHAVTDGMVLSLLDVSAQGIIDAPIGQFIDISSTGTPLNLANNGNSFRTTQVRNAIVQQSSIMVSSNGGIRLSGNATILTTLNAALPSGNAYGFGQGLFPFWDDIDTQGGVIGNIYIQELTDRLVVQWHQVGFAGQPNTERATFQVQLFDDSDLLAQFIYEDIEGARAARGASATIGYQANGILELQQFSFNAATVRNGTILSFYAATDFGTPYCVATDNSTGRAGVLTALGSDQVSANNLVLQATELPANATAFFIVSDTTFFVGNAGGSQGNLCLGGAIGRGVGGIRNSGAAGFVSVSADLTALPTSSGGTVAVLPGDSWNFQCWHRDAVGGVVTSNFTRGLQIRFRP